MHFPYPERDLNPHGRTGQRILSPSCLPFHHPGEAGVSVGVGVGVGVKVIKNSILCIEFFERKTGLEPATLTLARLCSTN